MQPEIIKLAPTLSPKERAKLTISNWHKAVEGKAVFNEAERKAILTPKYGDVDGAREFEYYFHLYKWANLFWRDEIDKIFLRFSILLTQLNNFRLSFGVDIVIKAAIWEIAFLSRDNKNIDKEDENKEKEEGAIKLLKHFEVFKERYDWDKEEKIIEVREESPLVVEPQKFIQAIEQELKRLFEYKLAVEEVEKELDGVPLFDENTYARFRDYWKQSEVLLESYNSSIERLETWRDFDDLKVVLKDKEQYLIKKPIPEKEAVNRLIADIKSLVESELRQFDILTGKTQ